MCIGGGGAPPKPTTPPAAPPAPAPITIQRLKSKRGSKLTRAGKVRRRGTARSTLVIPKKTGVQYAEGGSGVSV